MTAGIYEIVNVANGKRYVGQSINIARRLRHHWRDLANGTHFNGKLQRAVNKYGLLGFYWRVLESVSIDGLSVESVKTMLVDREQHHMEQTPAGFGYQICLIAGTVLGVRRSEETRARVAAAQVGRPPASAETRAKIATAGRGRVQSTKQRAAVAAYNRSRVLSPESRAKIAASLRGKTASAETREKMRRSHLGRMDSPETKRKKSAAALARLARS